MNDLVYIDNKNQVVCDSLQVAEKFGKRHDKLLFEIERKYGDLIGEGCAQNGGHPLFLKTKYKHEQNGQWYPKYLMNRDGFSLLVMGFSGKKALEWKIKYIEAFNALEKVALEKSNDTWLDVRNNSKLARRSETDVIQQLVEYAKEQGSQHADMLYVTYSKLSKKMSGIEDRNTATIQQLVGLTMIENVILKCIQQGMAENKPYKEIYQDCKNRVIAFKNIAYLEDGLQLTGASNENL